MGTHSGAITLQNEVPSLRQIVGQGECWVIVEYSLFFTHVFFCTALASRDNLCCLENLLQAKLSAYMIFDIDISRVCCKARLPTVVKPDSAKRNRSLFENSISTSNSKQHEELWLLAAQVTPASKSNILFGHINLLGNQNVT